MSIQAREQLVNHPHAIFERDSQRADLLNPALTQTELVALLLDILGKGHIVLFTAVRSDHHDDSGLNPAPPHVGTHAGGFAADTWPLASTRATDFLDASDSRLQSYLRDAAQSPWLLQIGLAGSADTAQDRAAAGSTVFSDGGADHIHLGANGD